MKLRTSFAMGLALFVLPASAMADLASKLEHLIGYTIIDSKTIIGWVSDDDDNDDDKSSFEGCNFDRQIKFDDGTTLTCAEYGYQYAYRPTAVILARKFNVSGRSVMDVKMIVEDEIYDMR